MTENQKRIVITGGAGYLGSLLTGNLLRNGYDVTVIDSFLHGGDAILGYLNLPSFHWENLDICQTADVSPHLDGVHGIIHLAGISGFPACQALGRELSRGYNVDATVNLLRAAKEQGVNRFIFPSTYLAYGSPDGNDPISESSPPNPQTLYAETKVEAEKHLLSVESGSCITTILRLADVYGISPRTRFDALVNQFVWQAMSRREIVIYQRGYTRHFIHIEDAVDGFRLILEAPVASVDHEVYNLGDDREYYSKQEVAEAISEIIPGTRIVHKDVSFGGVRRDLPGTFDKIRNRLGFAPRYTLREGILSIRNAIQKGLIREPGDEFHHNARFPLI